MMLCPVHDQSEANCHSRSVLASANLYISLFEILYYQALQTALFQCTTRDVVNDQPVKDCVNSSGKYCTVVHGSLSNKNALPHIVLLSYHKELLVQDVAAVSNCQQVQSS